MIPIGDCNSNAENVNWNSGAKNFGILQESNIMYFYESSSSFHVIS